MTPSTSQFVFTCKPENRDEASGARPTHVQPDAPKALLRLEIDAWCIEPVTQLSLRIAEFLSVLRDHYAEINSLSDPKRRQSSRPRSWTSSLSMAPRCSVYGIDTSPLTRGVTSNCAFASAL